MTIFRSAALLFTALLAWTLVPGAAYCESLSDRKQELEKLRRDLIEKKKAVKENRKMERSILGEVEDLDKKWGAGKRELRHYERNIVSIDEEIARMTRQKESMQRRVDSRKAVLDARIRRIFKEKQMGDLMLLAGGGEYPDFASRMHGMFEVSRRDQTALKEYRDGLQILKAQEDQLENKRGELVANKLGAAEKIESIQSEKMSKKMLLAKVRNEKEAAAEAVRELEESALKVQELMRQLARSSSSPTAFVSEKGKLPWPNNGELIGTFGRSKHPKFDFYVFKKGIEIRPGEDDYIRAVYGGSVAFADWMKGYGLLVIIDHGGSYYSLYAHASKLMVAAGDTVKQDQIIGEIGETGISADESLYFEIRHGGKAIDPAPWLAKRE